MDLTAPIVITSRAAQDHLADVKIQHDDIVGGIRQQAERVANYRATREASAMEADRNRAEDARKMAELDIKRAAIYGN